MRGISRLRRMGARLGMDRRRAVETLDSKYERRSPHAQNALDLIPGWTGSFPENHALQAGEMALYSDPRVHWALDQYGPLDGASVLELGPLEGAHSYMLEQRGAAEVLGIEANKQAFLKCLVAKEILGLTRCRFLLGDFEKYLAETPRHFDIILASGVLYHMQNPVQVLDMMGRKCNALILWTHYYDDDLLPADDPRRGPFSGGPTVYEHEGHNYTLYRRSYEQAWNTNSYCGGPDDTHYWMVRPEIEALCQRNGFNDIRVHFENADGVNGPSCLFYMRKT
ncbi:MAG: class I SAM-dependent methyltransferase [Pseudomonadota bacterium]